MLTIPKDLLESMVRDYIKTPFHIDTEDCTPLSDTVAQQLQEQGRFTFGAEYHVVEGYRVPVRYESNPDRVIFYQVFHFSIGDRIGWDVIPEQDIRERLLR